MDARLKAFYEYVMMVFIFYMFGVESVVKSNCIPFIRHSLS